MSNDPSRFLSRILSLSDFEALAAKRLPPQIFAYISGACEDGQSLKSNQSSFDEFEFRTRVLVDVSKRSQNISLFGRNYQSPIGIAPMGITALSAYRGDLVLAKAAQAANIPAIMSGSSLIKLEEVAQAAPDTWFQAYLPGKADEIEALIARVKDAGFKTLVLTVDTPTSANRENNVRAGFSTPLRPDLRLAWAGVTHPRWLLGVLVKTLISHGMPHFENNYARRGVPIISKNIAREFSDRGHLTWAHVESIRRQWQGQIVLKGVLNPLDAVKAKQLGLDGLIVSNHGGRQLDGAMAPMRALPEILEVFRDGPVMLDGGVLRGSSVLKAIALGASCVFIGRPFNYAAAVAGYEGVLHGIALIEKEISTNMAMLGVQSMSDVNRDCLYYLNADLRAKQL
jgi:L-lactate dehydrogenase (cytochrome)